MNKLLNTKYIVCFSGGHSSALCAIEAVKQHGKENIILLNHNITSTVEDDDIKRFKHEIAEYLELPITYANHIQWETKTPIDVCLDAKAWKIGNGHILCTNRLKTAPFKQWQIQNDPNKEYIYIYGFDTTPKERARAQRRAQIMGLDGYKTEFPLITWDITILNTKEINIHPPMTYEQFKHANCIGCLKAGWQHWYVVYCIRPDIWNSAKLAESEIGYAIHKDELGPVYLEDKESLFAKMKATGIQPTEHFSPIIFWQTVKQQIKSTNSDIPICQFNTLIQHDSSVCLDCIA